MLRDAIVLLLLGTLAVLLPFSRAYRSQLTSRLAADAGARVSPDQWSALEARAARRSWGMGAGILVAGLVVLVVGGLWEPDGVGGAAFLLSVLLVSGAAGLAVAEIWSPGSPGDGPRTARASAPGLEDYLPPLARVLVGVYTAAGLAVLAGTLLLARSEWFDAGTVLRSPVPVLAAAVPVLALLTWWAVRRVLDAPQPARDEGELYWQDAVRGHTLSSLMVPVPLVSLFSLVLCGSVLDDAASAAVAGSDVVGPAWTLAVLVVGYALPFVLFVLGLVVVVGPWRPSQGRHFRERLWGGRPPALAPDQAGA